MNSNGKDSDESSGDLIAILLISAQAAVAASCDAVRALSSATAIITIAQPVAPGAFLPQGARGADAFKKLPRFAALQQLSSQQVIRKSKLKYGCRRPDGTVNCNR